MMIDFYRYNDNDSAKVGLKARIARAKALISSSKLAANGRADGAAYASAVAGWIRLNLELPENEACDADQMVRMAEDAHHAAPSLASYIPLINALMYRAGRKLAADFPSYANATRGTARATPASYAATLAMERNDPLGKAARENKDVRRAAALAAERVELFPETRDSWSWAVLTATGIGKDEIRAKCLVPDDLTRILREVEKSLLPMGPRDALQTYFQRRAAGDATARQPLDKLVKLGIPLPVGLIP
jgi:hypothetical protein